MDREEESARYHKWLEEHRPIRGESYPPADPKVTDAIRQLLFERNLRKVAKSFIIKPGVRMKDMLEKLKRL